jgi:hypothetical protein
MSLGVSSRAVCDFIGRLPANEREAARGPPLSLLVSRACGAHGSGGMRVYQSPVGQPVLAFGGLHVRVTSPPTLVIENSSPLVDFAVTL